MPAADAVCLVMNMLGWMIRMQNQSFDVCLAEMKHARFAMIDPDDGVIAMLVHEGGLFQRSAQKPGLSTTERTAAMNSERF
jgi:hypothetical protein